MSAAPAHDDPVAPPPRAIDRILQPVGAFFANRRVGALMLMAAALAAVVWAASSAGDFYHQLLYWKVSIGFVDGIRLEKSLQHWINDGLMGVFFFLVGLEIKREVLVGELASVRKAALPGFAALGGMVAPALVYAAVNPEGPGARGWGIPMATDIAFALGVLAFLGDRVPATLRIFLTALAIVDDIGAVLVIAIFYTDDVALLSLGLGAVCLAVAAGMNRAEVRNVLAYFIVGTICWVCFLKSGVHATIAALLMAFAVPARTRLDRVGLTERLRLLLSDLDRVGEDETGHHQQHIAERLGATVRHASSPLIQLEHGLAGPVALLVLPLFALANAGVRLEGDLGDALSSPVALGVAAGLLVGKTVGVVGFSYLAVRLGLAALPPGLTWRHLIGAALLSGIGFTMALFIADLAFAEPVLLDQAKVGILTASVLAGLVGWTVLRGAEPRPEPQP